MDYSEGGGTKGMLAPSQIIGGGGAAPRPSSSYAYALTGVHKASTLDESNSQSMKTLQEDSARVYLFMIAARFQ